MNDTMLTSLQLTAVTRKKIMITTDVISLLTGRMMREVQIDKMEIQFNKIHTTVPQQVLRNYLQENA